MHFFINTISYFMIYKKQMSVIFLFIGLSKKTVFPTFGIYLQYQYLIDQPTSVFPSVTFHSCDCELLADNYVALK